MKKTKKVELLARDLRCLKLLKTVNRTAKLLQVGAFALVCAVVAADAFRVSRG